MPATTAISETTVSLRSKFIQPTGNKTGSFGVLPDSEAALETFRSLHGIGTELLNVRDSATGRNLKAFRPIEKDQLAYVRSRRISDGQVCIVTWEAVPRSGRMTWKFRDVRPV